MLVHRCKSNLKFALSFQFVCMNSHGSLTEAHPYCQIKLPSLQSIRLSTTTTRSAFMADQERPPRWKNHPAEEWVCNDMVPNASTSSLSHALVLSAHTYVCLLMPLIFDWLPHCCSFPDLGPLTQTEDFSASLWLHINMTERTNRIGDLTRHRIS